MSGNLKPEPASESCSYDRTPVLRAIVQKLTRIAGSLRRWSTSGPFCSRFHDNGYGTNGIRDFTQKAEIGSIEVLEDWQL